MSFSVSFEQPATGTELKRVWTSSETPPGSFRECYFDPDSSVALTGTPADKFVNDKPGTGNRLIVDLPTPDVGKTKTQTVTVTPSSGVSQDVKIVLHWEE